MTKQKFLEHCLTTYNTTADYPFDEDFETAVLRHNTNRKWYAIVMRVSRRKFGFDSDEVVDVVTLKPPTILPKMTLMKKLLKSLRCSNEDSTLPSKG